MDSWIYALKQTVIFSGFPEEVLRTQVLPAGRIQSFQKDQFLIQPRQKVDQFGILLSGRVHIIHISPQGNYSLTSVLLPGEIMGADLICTRNQIAPFHAIAAAATQVMYLPASILTAPGQLPEDCRLDGIRQLLTLISQENMKKEYRIAILSQKGLRERILTYLMMQANRRQANEFTIPFSREELASFLCVNRSALSHELSLMQQEGILSFRKNVFCIHTSPPAF